MELDLLATQLLFVLVPLVTVVLPLLVLVWLVRTLVAMRRDQAAMVRLLTSIESEIRAFGDRERGSQRPR